MTLNQFRPLRIARSRSSGQPPGPLCVRKLAHNALSLLAPPCPGGQRLARSGRPSFERQSNSRADSAWHRPVREKTSLRGSFLAPWPSWQRLVRTGTRRPNVARTLGLTAPAIGLCGRKLACRANFWPLGRADSAWSARAPVVRTSLERSGWLRLPSACAGEN